MFKISRYLVQELSDLNITDITEYAHSICHPFQCLFCKECRFLPDHEYSSPRGKTTWSSSLKANVDLCLFWRFRQHYKVHTYMYVISMEFSAVNRRRPSRETPLGPGAKKDSCFRRLCKCRQKCNHMVEQNKLFLVLLVLKPNLARYQEKQKGLPYTSSEGRSKYPTPPLSSEPDRKKTCRRDSVEPLERTSSPLPNLPDDLKTKQEKIDSVAQVNAKSVQRHTSPKQSSVSNGTGTLVVKTNVIPEGLRDPLQIISLIKENSKLGFLYMTPAVDRSSIEYNPYNLK